MRRASPCSLASSAFWPNLTRRPSGTAAGRNGAEKLLRPSATGVISNGLMSRQGKCHNYAGCLLAYRGEQTEVPDGQPFVCAECGKPLTEVKASMKKVFVYLLSGILLAALAAAAVVMLPKLKGLRDKKPATPAVAEQGSADTRVVEPPKPNPNKQGDAPPPERPEVPPPSRSAIDPATKAEVLKRIDVIPKSPRANKDKLYNSVQRARSMGLCSPRCLSLRANRHVPRATSRKSKTRSRRRRSQSCASDPTAVFVVLGYADPKGDAADNLRFSQTPRRQRGRGAMRDKCGVLNVTHAVAMGGSSLLDAKNSEKNRIVEVWARPAVRRSPPCADAPVLRAASA